MGGGRRKFKPRAKFVNKDRFIDASKVKERAEEEERKKPSMEEFLKSLREGRG